MTDDEFIKFMHSGYPKWVIERINPVQEEGSKMSGCHNPYVDEKHTCGCSCHRGGHKYMKLSHPPIPCCECSNFDIPKEKTSMVHDETKNECKCVGCISKRLDELEKKYESKFKIQHEILESLSNRICNLENNKYKLECIKPYKCPVCLGESKIQVTHGLMEPLEKRIIDSAGRHFKLCNACEGKGIVWG